MALGVQKQGKADFGVGITGIAGPGGGSAEKPVGLVYMACCLKGRTVTERWQFSGSRKEVREQSAVRAMELARRTILADSKEEGVK